MNYDWDLPERPVYNGTTVLCLNLVFSKKTLSEKPEVQREILLPLDWLLKPFRKRFNFHFYGNKQTNNLEKVRSGIFATFIMCFPCMNSQ